MRLGPRDRVFQVDPAGRRFREQRFLEIEEIGSYKFPTVIEVEDQLTGTKSRMVFGHVKFDVEIPPTLYSESIVRQRLRHGWQPDVPVVVE